MNKKRQAEIEALLADHEKWDEHVATEEHSRFLSDEEQSALDREIDDGLGLQLISIRLNKRLIDQLKGLAKLEGIGYQPLIRHALTTYARDNEYKLDALLSTSEAADRADQLFVHAMQLRNQISKLTSLSNERIIAETEYSKTLTQAQALFAQAIDKSQDPVLKQHANLRLAQIAEVCQREFRTETEKKHRKKKESA